MPSPAPSKQKSPSSRGKGKSIDLATIAGVLIAFFGILGGLIIEKGDVADVAQATAALIVLGGTFGAVLVTTPLPVALRAFKTLRQVLIADGNDAAEIAAQLIRYSTEARKSGIVSLEKEAAAIPDPFLRKAMSLAIDGADLQDLRRIMEVDIDIQEQSAEAEAKVWEAAGGYAPTIGIIGAVLGLIQVMKHLEDIRVVGHGIAVAFVATVYGVGCANIFFLPVAAKLRARLREKVLTLEMVIEGVSGIVQGLNPTLIRLKLESFIPNTSDPKTAPKGSKAGAPSAGAQRSREAAA